MIENLWNCFDLHTSAVNVSRNDFVTALH